MSEPENQEGGSPIESGMTKGRKQPRWTIPFLRALERTGNVRASAEEAGVDHTTAYNRRKAHSDFAAAWAEALEKGRAERKRVEEEEIAGLRAGRTPPLPARAMRESPSPCRGEGPSLSPRAGS